MEPEGVGVGPGSTFTRTMDDLHAGDAVGWPWRVGGVAINPVGAERPTEPVPATMVEKRRREVELRAITDRTAAACRAS